MKGLIQSAIIGGVLSLVPPIPKFHYDTPSLEKKAEIEAIINDLDPIFYKAIIKTESHWDPKAISIAGARGMSQLMPETIRKLGVKNPHDPFENIEGGARWLNEGIKEIGKKDYKLLAKWYNCGGPNLKKSPSCGNDYWSTVQEHMKHYRRLANNKNTPTLNSTNAS